MKKLLVVLCMAFICRVTRADTFNQYWYNESVLHAQTSCQTGGDINLPATAPTKYGYDFIGWEKLTYTPIEYLESTGTQWIDTGYIPDDSTNFDIGYMYTEGVATGVGQVLFGSREETSGSPGFLLSSFSPNASAVLNSASVPRNGYVRLGDGYNQATYSLAQSAYVFNTLKCDSYGYVFLNGNSVYNVPLTRNTPPRISLYMFALHTNTDIKDYAKGRIYYLKLYDNNTLVRHFIPVLDPTGTPCMYDNVTGQFFYNQGTGQFIAGPVLQ